MKQKLCLAQALMENSDILLLDEPTNALDRQSVVMAQDLLKEERDRGKYIIVATHTTEDFAPIADHFLRVEDGKLTAV